MVETSVAESSAIETSDASSEVSNASSEVSSEIEEEILGWSDDHSKQLAEVGKQKR